MTLTAVAVIVVVMTTVEMKAPSQVEVSLEGN
jgi:hypothetical protein